MAQTKTAGTKSKTKTAGAKSKSTSRRTARNGSRTRSSPNGSGARKRSGSKASRSGGGSSASRKRAAPSPVSKAMQRAKGPAIAGGAALVGLAGGLALKNGNKRSGLAAIPRPKVNLSLPKPKGSTVKILGGAAKEIAKGGYKIGQLTSEVQKVRQAVESRNSEK